MKRFIEAKLDGLNIQQTTNVTEKEFQDIIEGAHLFDGIWVTDYFEAAPDIMKVETVEGQILYIVAACEDDKEMSISVIKEA